MTTAEKKSRNMFQQTKIVKKSHVCIVQYIHSNPYTLLLTSRGLARKVRKLVLTLELTQEPKNVSRPCEVRL